MNSLNHKASTTLPSRHQCRRGIYQHSVAKGWFPLLAAVHFCRRLFGIIMRSAYHICLILIVLPVSCCVAADKKADVWSETNTACGLVFHFSHNFDNLDYSLIGQFIDEMPPSRIGLFYRAPYGPAPPCDSAWSKDMPYEDLRSQKEMATIRRDTYDSFIARNRYIAEHARSSFTTPAGHAVRILRKTRADTRTVTLTRVGFSSDGRQALICTESFGYLYEKSGDRWKRVGDVCRWVP